MTLTTALILALLLTAVQLAGDVARIQRDAARERVQREGSARE